MIMVAILGAGIGAEHLEGYRALPETFRVKTVCDLDAARAQSIIGDDPIEVETAADAVLSDPELDLIDICLPPHLHFGTALAALAAGKHVICEKPLVRSVREADALADAAAKAGRQVFPVFQYRFGRGLQQLKALQTAGLAGKAYTASIETHWNRDAAYYAAPWRGTWAGESGGAVLGHAIHNHDLLSYSLGPIAAVQAQTATRVNAIEVEDCAALLFEMQSGALVTSSVTLGAGFDETRLRFCFEGLTATSGTEPYAPGAGQWQFVARAPTTQDAIDTMLASLTPERSGYAGFFEAVAQALDGHPGRDVTLADGRRSIELVTAVYHAARTGTRVPLPLGKDHALYEGWQPQTAPTQ
ncbi:MAG: Gfo/Idh/MocA family oxidoreductase [Devosiaceae bacterium]|nr:Gfo/Idh/MocA family oxidoreductase [Devosiaceae bacterium MH13]